MEQALVAIGVGLGAAYSTYTLLLLASVAVGAQFLVALAYVQLVRKPTLAWLWWLVPACELLYALAHPLIYLAVLQPAFLARGSSRVLDLGAGLLLACVWGLRLFGGGARPGLQRRMVRVLAYSGAGLVCLFFAKDLFCDKELLTVGGDGLSTWLVAAALPLYAIPVLMGLRFVRATASDERWTGSLHRFFFARAASRWLAAPAMLVAVATVVAVEYQPSESVVRAALLEHRGDIARASDDAGLDRRLVASLIGVTLRSYTNPFRRALERAAVEAWLLDRRSHEGLSRALNPSLGIAQIKPITALTALALSQPYNGRLILTKEYRDLPLLEGWQSAPLAVGPPLAPGSGKAAVAEALLRPSENIRFCAFILALYAAQWRAANAAWAIDSRPEILASLYQLGFPRSHPKADPRPNDFGIEVRELYDSSWMREHFAGSR